LRKHDESAVYLGTTHNWHSKKILIHLTCIATSQDKHTQIHDFCDMNRIDPGTKKKEDATNGGRLIHQFMKEIP
jgi:hypothetical protein